MSFRHITDAIKIWCRRVLCSPNSVRVAPNEESQILAGVSVRSGDRKLTEPSEGLIRRVRKTPRNMYGPVHDELMGCFRAPAAAFEPRFPDPQKPHRPVDEALSVNVKSLLRTAGLPLTWGLEPRKQYAARITVAIALPTIWKLFTILCQRRLLYLQIPTMALFVALWSCMRVIKTNMSGF